MDTFSTAVLLLVLFLALQQNITWLWVGMLFLIAILVRRIGIIFVVSASTAALYFLKLQDYWFIFMMVSLGAVLLFEKKEEAPPEAYSPEMMQLLGGYGGR